MSSQIVIFTDLDGTLLDHDTYSYAAAEPCLAYLHDHDIPLIYTSSKTAIEIEDLCTQTSFQHPFIAENGGLLSIPDNYFSKDNSHHSKNIKTIIGKSRAEINTILTELKNIYKFTSFKDMSIDELISHTGLERQQAIYANHRDCTEPLLWLDDTASLGAFNSALIKHDLRLISGGRFHHVMGIHDKASTMTLLIKQFEKFCNKQVVSIALGDSPNDLEMLRNADFGIVIPNQHAPKMCIDNHATLVHAENSGPLGWNDSLLKLLKELNE